MTRLARHFTPANSDAFSMPAETAKSPMEKIWFIVAMVPKGRVSSYGKLADLAGLPGRARYVSKALKMAPEH
ncbi:hypothetical protein SVI_2378 [Shewanella violacea DSS12]|uniref:Methylated-DNA-[protein]-cysteine S-methyltransferase DNA binding domain-containing protein n=1 Tax=Shewanella violacea (strain JCM 10179 / CIP 106290 / LMG 19151 / DSS12) TaxID=637905 RepID=D4ZL00_SHEVD|nr:hypothetical protein SVI_2378 [Shewanella violacea DSS12]